VIIQKAFKYRFFPTDEQAAQLAKTFGCARYVYNQGLEYRTTAWQQEKKPVGSHMTAAKLTEWKKDGQITLAKQDEPLNISWSRPLPNDAKLVNLTVSKDKSERYFVSVLVETDVKPLKKVKAEVGIDVGVKILAATSDGDRLENPRPLVRREKRLKKLQRRLSRKVKGSNNRKKAKLEVAKLHAKIGDTRRDTIQKFTTKIIRENQAIFVEGLNVAGMMQNHRLAKHIGDAAFDEIFRELEYKACWNGRTYFELDRFFPSSKLCSSCGHLLNELPLSVREWDCPGCGTHHDRDINAAVNILKAGQYLLNTRSGAGKFTPMRHKRRRSA
jgi:putative transposase